MIVADNYSHATTYYYIDLYAALYGYHKPVIHREDCHVLMPVWKCQSFYTMNTSKQTASFIYQLTAFLHFLADSNLDKVVLPLAGSV